MLAAFNGCISTVECPRFLAEANEIQGAEPDIVFYDGDATIRPSSSRIFPVECGP